MSSIKHKIPAGLEALSRRGLSSVSLGKILGLRSHVGAAKRLRGVSPITCTDLFLIGEALNLRPEQLFDARVAELPVPSEFMDARRIRKQRPERRGKTLKLRVDRELFDEKLPNS